MAVPKLGPLDYLLFFFRVPWHLAGWLVRRYVLQRNIFSPYLQGNFGPVDGNIDCDASELEVTGSIPSYVHGQYVRNGPNPLYNSTKMPYHWFDGDGMLHAVHIKNGNVTSYRSKWVETERHVQEQKAGYRYITRLAELATLPGVIWFLTINALVNLGVLAKKKWASLSSANTAVVFHARRFFALVEAGLPTQVKLPQLETVGEFDYEGKLKHPFTAHPKVDADSGRMFFFAYSQDPYVNYSVADAKGNLESTLRIKLPFPVMIHDFAIGGKYAILPDLPLQFRPELVFLKPGTSSYVFNKKGKARFGIFPRDNPTLDGIKWFSVPSCYMFHTANAWEEGDEVVLQGCRSEYTDALGLEHMSENLENKENLWDLTPEYLPYLHEWRFNMSTGEVSERQLSSVPCEFPAVNPALLTRPTRYTYLARVQSGETMMDTVMKYDAQTEKVDVLKWKEDGKHRNGEFIFVENPNGTSEDDGVLVGYVHNETNNQSRLSIIDARKMTEIAAVHLPRRVPYGFHGIFVPQAEIDAQKC